MAVVSWYIRDSLKRSSCRARQAHQDIFGMVEVTTIVEYVVHRLRNAVYEEWAEDKIVLCRCLPRVSVDFCDYRELLTDLIELWLSIRPFIRCTVNPEARRKPASVSIIAIFGVFVLVLHIYISEISVVAVLATSFSVVVTSSSVLSVISVIVASSVEFSVGFPNRTSPNSVSQACAYQSLWVVSTSGSWR